MNKYHTALAEAHVMGHTADELIEQVTKLSLRLATEVANGEQNTALSTQYKLVLVKNELARRLGSDTRIDTESVADIAWLVRR